MDFIIGIIFVLVIIFIMIKYTSISISNNNNNNNNNLNKNDNKKKLKSESRKSLKGHLRMPCLRDCVQHVVLYETSHRFFLVGSNQDSSCYWICCT